MKFNYYLYLARIFSIKFEVMVFFDAWKILEERLKMLLPISNRYKRCAILFANQLSLVYTGTLIHHSLEFLQ